MKSVDRGPEMDFLLTATGHDGRQIVWRQGRGESAARLCQALADEVRGIPPVVPNERVHVSVMPSGDTPLNFGAHTTVELS